MAWEWLTGAPAGVNPDSSGASSGGGFAGGPGSAAMSAGLQGLNAGLGQMQNKPDPGAGLNEDLAMAMQYLQPYLDVAGPALQGLQGLSTPQGQASAVNQYTNSSMYDQQMASAQEAAARSANATGYGRSGQAIIEQSQIPLQLQQNYLNDQTARYGQLAGFGSQPSSQAFSGTIGQGQFGAQLDQNMQLAQMQKQAQEDANSSGFWGDLLGIGASLIPWGDTASDVADGFGGYGEGL